MKSFLSIYIYDKNNTFKLFNDYYNQRENVVREYRIPGRLVKAGKNVIASRVYSFFNDGGLIGPSKRMVLAQYDLQEETIPLAGEWKYNIEYNFGLVVPPESEPGPGNSNSPYMLYDNMIAPLVPYALRGVIWY